MLYIKKTPTILLRSRGCEFKIPCCVLFLCALLSSAETENTKLEMKAYIVFPNAAPITEPLYVS